MSDKKIIAVVGATGAQGGGLAHAILADTDSEFAVRALTRNPGGEKAKALADAGAEIVRADIDDIESLKAAFAGAYGAFCLTSFWEHMSPEKEKTQAANMAKAAKESGVRHVIWSTLEDTRKWVPLDDERMPTLMEKYKVPHFDAKGEANEVFTKEGVPTTFLHTSFYWDNLIHFGMNPKPGEDGTLQFVLPMGDAKLPGISADDIGKCALGIFRRGDEFIGSSVGIAGEHLSGKEMAEVMTTSLGRTVHHQDVSFDVFRGFGFPGADDLGNMFQVKHDFEKEFRAPRHIDFSRTLNPALKSFADWMQENKNRLPLE
jgi:uncharacterized protein YbjT (DUF2867 family)